MWSRNLSGLEEEAWRCYCSRCYIPSSRPYVVGACSCYSPSGHVASRAGWRPLWTSSQLLAVLRLL